MGADPTGQRDRRELISQKGVVLGIIWIVQAGEPCWKDLDMFFWSFRFEAAPAFDIYRPIFDALMRAVQADADRLDAWMQQPSTTTDTPESEAGAALPWPNDEAFRAWLRKAPHGRPQKHEADPFRIEVRKAMRIRGSDGEVWMPLVLYIDGECGWARSTRVHCRWNGSEWVSMSLRESKRQKGGKPRWRFWSK
jgi:hypothetical protein